MCSVCVTIVLLVAIEYAYFAHTVNRLSGAGGGARDNHPNPMNNRPAPQLRRTLVGEGVVRRVMRRITNVDEAYYWFESHGVSEITSPHDWIVAQPSDIFVHKVGGDVVQMWLRTAERQWLAVQVQHVHPSLVGYVLQLSEGEPRWVKKETLQKKIRSARPHTFLRSTS